ncbi:MAG: hypothetical protein U5L96_09680 [Owenweeksia sp.]|nr:hypothetical protein [Owenweeksia sp.]
MIKEDKGEDRWKFPYYVFLDSSIRTYTELVNSEATLSRISEEFLLPIIDSYLNANVLLPEAETIMTTCKKARVLIGDIKKRLKSLLVRLKRFLKELQNLYRP